MDLSSQKLSYIHSWEVLFVPLSARRRYGSAVELRALERSFDARSSGGAAWRQGGPCRVPLNGVEAKETPQPRMRGQGRELDFGGAFPKAMTQTFRTVVCSCSPSKGSPQWARVGRGKATWKGTAGMSEPTVYLVNAARGFFVPTDGASALASAIERLSRVRKPASIRSRAVAIAARAHSLSGSV